MLFRSICPRDKNPPPKKTSKWRGFFLPDAVLAILSWVEVFVSSQLLGFNESKKAPAFSCVQFGSCERGPSSSCAFSDLRAYGG